jgi:hypothetical protein
MLVNKKNLHLEFCACSYINEVKPAYKGHLLTEPENVLFIYMFKLYGFHNGLNETAVNKQRLF